MKLIAESGSPLRNGSTEKDEQNRHRWFKKLLHLSSSNTGVTIIVGIISFLLVTGAASLPFFGASRYIDENGKSLQNVYAEKQIDVEDKDETQRKIERARQGVPIVYREQAPLNRAMRESLNHIVNDLSTLTDGQFMGSANEKALRDDLVGESPEAKVLLERLSKKPLSEEYWNKISAVSHATMNKMVEKGITPYDYIDHRDELINKALPSHILGALDESVVKFILSASLQPNIVVDEGLMEKRRSEAETAVKPATRMYRPMEQVVTKGEKVTAVQVAALQKMGKSVIGNNWVGAFGVLLLALAMIATLWYYIYGFDEKRYFKPSYAGMLTVLMLLGVIGFELLIGSLQNGLLLYSVAYAFPLATLPLTVSIFTHPRIGLMTAVLLTFFVGMVFRVEFPLLATLLFGSMMGVYILSRRLNFRDRGQLMYSGLYIGFTNVILIFALHLLQTASFLDIDWRHMGLTMVCGFAGGILSGVLTLGFLPFLESLFRLVTPYTLMELANHDHPLLRRMQFEAPGTFHHSLMTASLSEAASEAIGADALLTRVGCLYHDIGKMKRPLFFIENQAYFGADNPHDKLTPRLSKMVITAHPKDSLEMARYHRIPESVQRFMTEHHGTMMAAYFYNKACQEEGADNVNKSQFRYPGPKPQSKETAIVMLADACESAVRALKSPTIAQIEERIDKIIWQRIDDGQFEQCPLTFKDISIIKETFIRVLRGIQHNRIEYQQSIMRDLGRKMQAVNPSKPDPGKIDELIKDIQKSAPNE
ncbi:MAG: HDIG domain-containing protein [Vampirovibrionales bacterium]|nr:HDIG domain-containing protein [Vampirovibrionales bacterium]